MRLKTILCSVALTLAICSGLFSFIAIQGFMQLQLTKTEIRMNFVRLLENEQVRAGIMDLQYATLMTDYCLLQNDLPNWLFRYTQADAMQSSMQQIEQLVKGPLQQSHQRLQWQCKPAAAVNSLTTVAGSK